MATKRIQAKPPRKPKAVAKESRAFVKNAMKTMVPSEEKEEKREPDEWDELITEVPSKLTRDQERFCRVYVSATEFYGNGVQSYITAFDVEIVRDTGKRPKIEKGKRKQMTYNSVKTESYKLLTNPYILDRVNELLEEGGFNDEFVDKQLKFLINQSADPRVKLGAIQEFNKLKQRIHEKSTMVHSFAYEDMPDDELKKIIADGEKFFQKK